MAMKNFTDMMLSILPQKDASIEKPWHGCHYPNRGKEWDDKINGEATTPKTPRKDGQHEKHRRNSERTT